MMISDITRRELMEALCNRSAIVGGHSSSSHIGGPTPKARATPLSSILVLASTELEHRLTLDPPTTLLDALLDTCTSPLKEGLVASANAALHVLMDARSA